MSCGGSTAENAIDPATNTTNAVAGEGPLLVLNEDFHDFGKVAKGSDVHCVFEVTNAGNQPLIISDCEKTCGCTVPQCDKNPIAPGAKSEIKVTYDSEREGAFNKTVKVISNSTDGTTKIIRIKGEVLKEGEEPATE